MGKFAQIDDMWGKMPVLLALSRIGTLDGVAEHLNVNRTTVSRRLKALEENLGGRLFVRSEGIYTLTPLGREILVAAEAAEFQLAQVESVLPLQEEPGGPLTITMAPNIAPVIASVMVDIARRRPDIKLDLCSTYELQQLEAREADIALRILRTDPQYPLFGRRLKKLSGALYGCKKTDMAKPVQIVRHDEVELPQSYVTWKETAAVIRTDDIIAKQELIAAGGIGRLPVFMGDADPRLKRMSDVLPDAGWALWLLTHEAFRASPRLQMVISTITQHFQKMPDL